MSIKSTKTFCSCAFLSYAANENRVSTLLLLLKINVCMYSFCAILTQKSFSKLHLQGALLLYQPKVTPLVKCNGWLSKEKKNEHFLPGSNFIAKPNSNHPALFIYDLTKICALLKIKQCSHETRIYIWHHASLLIIYNKKIHLICENNINIPICTTVHNSINPFSCASQTIYNNNICYKNFVIHICI